MQMASSRKASSRQAPREARVGIDIGGTFTDIVLHLSDGTLHISKVSSSMHDPGIAVIEGLADLLAKIGVAPGEVKEIIHGTTVGSNTILQRKGARTGLVTTKGFRDVLEIGRIRTPVMFDLAWVKPVPLVPRRHRLEVDERMAADGTVVRPLDPAEVASVGRELVAEGIETVAICFINSYANPAHEAAARRVLREQFPQLDVTTSYDVLPELKEYERTSTTVVNAYLLKAMRTYLSGLTAGLARIGITAPLLVVTSNGGMMGVATASEKPVHAVASGPAGGVAGAARLGRAGRDDNVIVFDMGGTTAKASIIEDGEPMLTAEYEFRDGMSSPSRFIKGGGYMLKIPSIDIAEVGAGGGSIARIDAGGILQVGPDSAGAEPGPACYGQGNDRPTVTDANVVLGYFNPASLAGGTKAIDRARAVAAIEAHVAKPLGLPLMAAAHGVREVANANMARAIRSVTVERGRDARRMTLMAFGGSGPAHAADVARILGIRRIVVPILSGVFCSVGMLASDIEHNFARTVLRRLALAGAADIDPVVAQLKSEGTTTLAREGYAGRDARLSLAADLRYVGQSSELTVPFPDGRFTESNRNRLHAAFQREYLKTFGYNNDEPLELVNLRLTARGIRRNRLGFTDIAAKGSAVSAGTKNAQPVRRQASFSRGGAPTATPILPRTAIAGERRRGPLIVESYDTTIVIPADATCHCDERGSIVITLR
jgi:N-methylhydantoinase A